MALVRNYPVLSHSQLPAVFITRKPFDESDSRSQFECISHDDVDALSSLHLHKDTYLVLDSKLSRFAFLKAYAVLTNVVATHLKQGGKAVICMSGKRDNTQAIARWTEFAEVHPGSLGQRLFCNFKANEFTAALSSCAPIFFELGDHADDAIQAASAVRRKGIPIEEIYDDCGENDCSLDLPDESTKLSTLFVKDNDSDSPTDLISCCSEDTENDEHHHQIYSWYLSGSENDDDHRSFMPGLINHETFCQSYATLRMQNSIDLVEIFGGQGGVLKLAFRKQLACGRNFDLATGVDLSNKNETTLLFKYLEEVKPFVVILAPPCTAFGSWSNYNYFHAHEAWSESYRIGRPLAELAAAICFLQLKTGRHFVCENPWSSSLWLLPNFVRLLNHPNVVCAHLDQCQVGLVDMNGLPSRKSTAFVASDETLIWRLRLKCDHSHEHSQLAGTLYGVSKTRFAQTWPVRLCEKLVAGIAQLKQRKQLKAWPPAYPSSSSSTDVCKACKSHCARDDNRHTRVEGRCNFPFDASVDYSCPACIKFKHSNHKDHTRIDSECRYAGNTRRSGLRVSRDPYQPADQAPEEAAEDYDEATVVPRKTDLGNWFAVRDETLRTALEDAAEFENWIVINNEHALVQHNCKDIVTPEPRFSLAKLSERSTFGRFQEHPHSEGLWWQLEDHVNAGTRHVLPDRVSTLICIFHRTPHAEVASSSIKNKPEYAPTKAFDDWSTRFDEPATETIVEDLVEPIEAGESIELPKPLEPVDTKSDALAIPANPIDWSSWDMGKALKNLRTGNNAVVIRAVRQLHLRWWHASANKMIGILRSAGLPPAVLDQIRPVCDTCRICRLWKRPSDRPQTSLKLTTEFNTAVELDLLFIGSVIVLHMVDTCIRWSAARIIASKAAGHMLPAIVDIWFRLFGPPKVLISDHESALCSEEAAIWIERWGTSFSPKPVGSHATTVERHHAIFRSQYLHIKAQSQAEGLQVSDEDIVAECAFAKNAMLQIHGETPYQALFGRIPHVMAEFERPGVSMVADSQGGSISRHVVRLRELSLQAIVEGSAKERLARASKTQTRSTAELLNLSPGDLVDIHRQPNTKESVGWRGPAEVVSIAHLQDGYVDVKWGGRPMSVRIPDIRRALTYINIMESPHPALELLQTHVAEIHACIRRYCFVYAENGWILTKHARENLKLFRAGIHVGYNTFGIRCIGCRVGCGVSILPGMTHAGHCILLWWPGTSRTQYRTFSMTGEGNISLKQVFGDDWAIQHWIQFISASVSVCKFLKELLPDEPMLGENPTPPDEPMDPPDVDLDEARDVFPPAMPPSTAPSPMNTSHDTSMRTPVSTGSTMRSRSTRIYSKLTTPHRTPTATDSSMSISTTPPTRPPRSQITRADYHKPHQPPPGYTPIRFQQGGSSASTGNANTPTLPPVEPSPPPTPPDVSAHDDDDDLVDLEEMYQDEDASTVTMESDWPDTGYHSKYPPPIMFGLTGAEHCERIAKEQACYLAETVTALGPFKTRSITSEFDFTEIEFTPLMARFIEDLPPICFDEVAVVYLSAGPKGKVKLMVEKNYDSLTTEDIKKHWPLVEAAIRKEIRSFFDMECFEVTSRSKTANICSSRWVLRWKEINGVRSVKARLTIRGYEDLAVDAVNYAGTASRWGQRLINSVSVQRKWALFTSDVSSAFLRGLTFQEIAEMSGSPIRQVAFTPPKESERYFNELPGLAKYDHTKDVLNLLKPAYGLKDAPKAWRQKLDITLREAGGQPLHTDNALYVWFSDSKLVCMLSTHVDDIKGTGQDEVVTRILQQLTAKFGELKTSWNTFDHCGLKHDRNLVDGTLKIHQSHYIAQLKLQEAGPLLSVPANTPLSVSQIAQYLSLLGAVSWLTQTRLDVAVYVCALQRAAKKPCAEHALRLNKVVKWCKRKASCLFYKYMVTPCHVVVISDSAFRKEDSVGLAMRGSVIAIGESRPEGPGGTVHLIEYYSRKQRRVTRSTFSAELNAASDAYEFGKLISMTLAELISPLPQARSLITLEETGCLPIPVDLVIDAKSVFDALIAPEIRPPSEISLVMMLCQIKEAMLARGLRTLFWCDTRDMVADGLNKGACTRENLLTLANTGEWKLTYPTVQHTESRYVPIQNARSLLFDLPWSPKNAAQKN